MQVHWLLQLCSRLDPWVQAPLARAPVLDFVVRMGANPADRTPRAGLPAQRRTAGCRPAQASERLASPEH
jgi:hypothetical protein